MNAAVTRSTLPTVTKTYLGLTRLTSATKTAPARPRLPSPPACAQRRVSALPAHGANTNSGLPRQTKGLLPPPSKQRQESILAAKLSLSKGKTKRAFIPGGGTGTTTPRVFVGTPSPFSRLSEQSVH